MNQSPIDSTASPRRPRVRGEFANTSACGWIIAAVFVVDLLTPLLYAVPILYLLPILLTWMMPGRQSTIRVVGSALMLTWIRVPFSSGELTLEAFIL